MICHVIGRGEREKSGGGGEGKQEEERENEDKTMSIFPTYAALISALLASSVVLLRHLQL